MKVARTDVGFFEGSLTHFESLMNGLLAVFGVVDFILSFIPEVNEDGSSVATEI